MKTILVEYNGKEISARVCRNEKKEDVEKQVINRISISGLLENSKYLKLNKRNCEMNTTCYSVVTENQIALYMVMECDAKYVLVGYFENDRFLFPIYTSDNLFTIMSKRDNIISDACDKLKKSDDDMVWSGVDSGGRFILKIIEIPANDIDLTPANFGMVLNDLTKGVHCWVSDFISKYGCGNVYRFSDEHTFGFTEESVRDVKVFSGNGIYINNAGDIYISNSKDDGIIYRDISDMVIDELFLLPDLLLSDLKNKRNKNNNKI